MRSGGKGGDLIEDGEAGRRTASSQLFEELRRIHLEAGKPSARAIAKTVGNVSHTTVAEALAGKRLPSWAVLARIVEHLSGDLIVFQHMWADFEYRRQGKAAVASDPSARSVLVIHGRNEAVRRMFFDFLRSIDLRPLEWEEVLHRSDEGAPFLHTVLRDAMLQAQAVVVLLTPDELIEPALSPGCPEKDERRNRVQEDMARPNVIFELGMAIAMRPESTIVAQIGKVRPITDLDGVNVVRLDGSPSSLTKLSNRLKAAGCAVDDRGSDWLDPSRFAGLAGTPQAQPDQSRVLSLDAVLHALSDPTRLAVVAQLEKEGETRVGALSVGGAKSTLAQHLRVLREAGVTHTRPDGSQRWLSVRRDALDLQFPHLLDAVIKAHARAAHVATVDV